MTKLLILLIFIDFVFSDDLDRENDVIVLNEDNFDDVISSHRPILVNFYSPWCQYSKKLLPHFERVAQDFVSQNVSIRLGKVDITMEKLLAKRFDIKRYPTLIFFKEDRIIFYNKTNNYVTISNWLISKTDNLILKVNSLETYEKVIKEQDDILMIDESKLSTKFYLVAEKTDDMQFVVVNTKLFTSLFTDFKEASLIMRRKVDLAVIPYYGLINQESISIFLLSNDLPPVITFTNKNGPRVFSNPYKPKHFMVFAQENLDMIEIELKKAAVNHNEIRFAIMDVSQNVTESIIKYFKVDIEKLPLMILSDLNTNKTFKPDFSDIDGVKIDKFVKGVKDGLVEEFLKSQPIPENWNSEPVKVLVGKNFEEIAYDKSKNVFVEFYAPWCSHCKQLAPIWERLAQMLSDVPDLIIAKMDKTENDIKEIVINAFPTIKLFLKDTNEIIPYTGLRTKQALLDFLVKYTNVQVDGGKTEL